MLITESQMGYYGNNGLNLGFQLLNEMYYLDAEQSAYTPAMVPVVENSDLGRVIVRLEDLQNFCEANGISDMGYAIQLICEADGINPSYVGFSIASNKILSDPDLADLSAELLNNGVCVVATPVNESDAACLAVDVAMHYLLENYDTTMLEAIMYDDYDTFFNEADKLSADELKKITDEVGKGKYTVNNPSADDYREGLGPDLGGPKDPYDYDVATRNAGSAERSMRVVSSRKDDMGTLSKIWDKVKNGVNISRDWIAKQLDRLNAWMRKIKADYNNTPEKDRGILKKIKNAIATVIQALTRKLHNLIATKQRGEIGEWKNWDAPKPKEKNKSMKKE